MKEKREKEYFMNPQSAEKGYTASRSYLSEVRKDKEWEKNYRSRKLSKVGHDPREDSRIPGKKFGVAREKDIGTFI